ncbi:MAG: polymer-forming cytoskeletal protein [Bacteroidota bacterium]
MLEAKALVYAIVVALLIAIMSSLLVSLSYMQRLQQIDQFDQERQMRNVQSGIALLMDGENDYASPALIDLFGKGEDWLLLGKKDWGLFSAAYVRAVLQNQYGNDTLSKMMLLGQTNQHFPEEALYLVDLNKPLGLAGNTQIKGKAFLPKAGVKRASVGGQGYLGSQLIYGVQQKSRSQLPVLKKEKINFLLQQLQGLETHTMLPEVLDHPFWEEPLLFQSGNLYLDQHRLKGNLIVYSTDTLYVGASAQLEDLLLCAPTIIIQSGFSGSLQAFAFDHLHVEANCQLTYPSVAGTLRQSEAQITRLTIGEQSRVEGMVFSYEAKYFRQGAKIQIQQGAKITGQVYASGVLELAGTVYGNVSCKQFFLRAGGGTYDNHLLNAVIDRSRLPKHFVGPQSTKQGKTQEIAKWIE